MFYECHCVECLFSYVEQHFQNTLILTALTPHAAIFGILYHFSFQKQ